MEPAVKGEPAAEEEGGREPAMVERAAEGEGGSLPWWSCGPRSEGGAPMLQLLRLQLTKREGAATRAPMQELLRVVREGGVVEGG